MDAGYNDIKMNVNVGKKQCLGCMEFYDNTMDVCPRCGYEEGQRDGELLHINPGEILAERYIIGRVLGYGGFGVTYIGWDIQLKRKVAIKEYLPSEFATRMIHRQNVMLSNSEKKQKQFKDGMERFLREGEKLAHLGNINGVVYMYDCFEANNTAYMVMEYLEGETLASYLEREGSMTEKEAMEMMMPILQALEIVHEKGIIHRDIAPDNIFLSIDGEGGLHVKLIDFGAAKYATTSHSKSLTVIIKPGYSPEEQYRSDGNQGTYTDVYAVAATMYKMVTGVQPPDAFERRTFIENKKKDMLEELSKYNKELSANFEIAILNAMNVKIEDRTATVLDFENELISYENVKRRGSSIRKIDFMKWPLWAKICVPIGGIVAVALVVLVIQWVFSSPESAYTLPEGMTRVPDFVSADFNEAQEWATQDVLIVGSAGSEFVPNIEADIVLSQDVAVGSVVVENTVINLTVSTGEEKYLMPDVRGLGLDDAKTRLECMGLTVETEKSEKEGLQNDVVIAQNTEPYAEVKTGDNITLLIAANGDNTGGEVPSFVGMTYEEAIESAASSGVEIVVKEKEFTSEYNSGEVIKQSIQPGEMVSAEKVIELTVAMENREFSMPNLFCKDKETALVLLDNIGVSAVVLSEYSEVVAKGLVLQQSVDKDSQITSGEKIELVLSDGSKPFAMPEVVGKSEEDARQILSDSGLAVRVESGYADGVDEGDIISQSVAKGKNVYRGTSVKIVVCSMEGMVKVEDVTDMSTEEATDLLESQGLVVQTEQMYSDTVAAGNVVSQLPEEGSVQEEGATIVLSISRGRRVRNTTTQSTPTPQQPTPQQPAPQQPAPTEQPGNPAPDLNRAQDVFNWY